MVSTRARGVRRSREHGCVAVPVSGGAANISAVGTGSKVIGRGSSGSAGASAANTDLLTSWKREIQDCLRVGEL